MTFLAACAKSRMRPDPSLLLALASRLRRLSPAGEPNLRGMPKTLRLLLCLLFVGAIAARTGAALAQPGSDYQIALGQYVERVGFLIRQNIDLRFVKSRDAEAVVAIRFAPDGKFSEAIVQERSGDPNFDLALESAVRRSVPILPPPPARLPDTGPFTIHIRFVSRP